jgi:hypothetical protein
MASIPSTRRAATRPRHGTTDRRTPLTVVSPPQRKRRLVLTPRLVCIVAGAFTLGAILFTNGNVIAAQVHLQDVQAQVAAASALHDQELLQQESMESPLRITQQVARSARLVTPVAETQIAPVGLNQPVRTIEVGAAPVVVAATPAVAHSAGASTATARKPIATTPAPTR